MSQRLNQLVDHETRELTTRPGTSWILRAPAGSGKTTLLVTRYLELLSTVEKPEEILAITFTRKATAEMRERILTALSDPESGHPTNLIQAAKRARQRGLDKGWEILANPTRLKIQTIESFRRSLIEASPVEAAIAPRTRLVQDAGAWYQEAVERVFRSLQGGERKSACVARLLRLEHYNLPRVKRQLVDMLGKRDQWSGKLFLPKTASNPIETPSWLEEKMQGLWDTLKDHTSINDLACILNLAEPVDERAFLQDPATWRTLASLSLTAKGELRKRLDKALHEDAKALLKPLLTPLSDTYVKQLTEARLFPDLSPKPKEREHMATILASLEVSEDALLALFEERGTIDLVELGFGATRSLGNDELPTDLIIALDYSIKHILVDEFQDTSVTQTEFLHSLIREWMPGDGRSFFAVGDPMQSIYGFREAEVGLFFLAQQQGMGQVIDKGQRALTLHAASLESNFRSDERLVEWVNRVFPQAMGGKSDLPTGSVRFEPAVSTKVGDPALDQLGVQAHLFQASDASKDADGQETAFIATYVAKLLKSHREDQIAILLRNRTHSRQLLSALRSKQVAYQGSELDRLLGESVVQDVLALAQSIAAPTNKLANFALLRSPAVGLSLSSLHRLAVLLRRGGTIESILEQASFLQAIPAIERGAVERLLPLLKGFRKEYHKHPPRPLIERAWVLCGFASVHADPRAVRSAQAVFSLIEAQQQGWIDFPALDRELANLYAPSESDARLVIMTIHQAKGLEFDHVLLPFVTKIPRADEQPSLRWRQSEEGLLAATRHGGDSLGSMYAWLGYEHTERVLNETKRLLYVAVTRAKKSLCLTGTLAAGSIAGRQGSPILTNKANPRKDSLLNPIWNQVQTIAKLHLQRRTGPQTANAKQRPLQCARLPSGYACEPHPTFAELRLASAYGLPGEEHSEGKWEAAPERSLWQGRSRISASVGNVVHEGLKWLSGHSSGEAPIEQVERLRPLLRSWLMREWLEGQALESALRQAAGHLVRALGHRDCQWILQPRDSAQSESAFTTVSDNRLVNLRVDRTFIEDGVRFIIDYKTAKPLKQESRVDFRERQIREHSPQLKRYATAFRQFEDIPITAALFLTSTPELVTVPLEEALVDESADV